MPYMFTGEPRVQVPKTANKGEIFQVKALISHAMETGLRRDEQGAIVPRKIINKFTCRYADEIVFSIDLNESVAANPYFEFYVEATTSGLLEFIWEEDGGGSKKLQQSLVVA
jgi:sulfur-oxidizing protein SoxZ